MTDADVAAIQSVETVNKEGETGMTKGETIPSAGFSALPTDVSEFILLHLTPYGDLQNCRLVCRAWNQLASGALNRLRRLHRRCDNFEWYYLEQHSNARTNIAERCSHSACYHSSGNMYVFGGCTAAYTTFNDLWRFDLSTRCWSRPVPSGNYPTPKACATMVEYDSNLYLYGGWSKSSPNPIHQTAMFFNEMHQYDPVANSWTVLQGEGAPHLAGHSASVIGDRMIVFGGSYGNGSSNQLHVYDFNTHKWTQAETTGIRPSPRYGQSMIVLDVSHLLVVGGCGGPNMIFTDVWLLTMADSCTWQEVQISNNEYCAPQLWSHPGCQVGNSMVVLSKRLRTHAGSPRTNRYMSMSEAYDSSGSTSPTPPNAAIARGGDHQQPRPSGSGSQFVPPQGNLIPPRRKLLTSRSLDEQEPPPSPSRSTERRPGAELQRASSIPAIIVGEIPRLVVTKEDSSADNGENGSHDQPSSSGCIALVGSSLLPNQATQVEAPRLQLHEARHQIHHHYPDRSPSALPGTAGGPAAARSQPSIKPNANANRDRRLEILQRMEEYIRSRAAQTAAANNAASGNNGGAAKQDRATNSASTSASVSPKVRFRPSSPPPKFKHRRSSDVLFSRNPMNVYVLELDQVLTHQRARWRIVDGPMDAPEDTILYSLIQARAELVMFGGMRSSSQAEQQALDVTPFTHTITNETYILRPEITLL